MIKKVFLKFKIFDFVSLRLMNDLYMRAQSSALQSSIIVLHVWSMSIQHVVWCEENDFYTFLMNGIIDVIVMLFFASVGEIQIKCL